VLPKSNANSPKDFPPPFAPPNSFSPEGTELPKPLREDESADNPADIAPPTMELEAPAEIGQNEVPAPPAVVEQEKEPAPMPQVPFSKPGKLPKNNIPKSAHSLPLNAIPE